MNSSTTRRAIPLFLAVGFGLWTPAVAAAVPASLTHQGRLFDTNGPVDATISMSFAIYPDPGDPTPLWTEVHSVTVEDGYFSVALGSVNALGPDLFDGSVVYLGITVGMDPEMAPRAPIRSVPYALLAGDVRGDIHPTSVTIPGVGVVIDSTGNWVGSPTGLQGPAGPVGPQGPAGSPDTGDEIVAKINASSSFVNSTVTAFGLSCGSCVSVNELDFNPATQAELDAMVSQLVPRNQMSVNLFSSSVNLPFNATQTVTATCPGNTLATGGACSSNSAPGVSITSTAIGASTYSCTFVSGAGAGTTPVTAQVACLNLL